MNNTVPSMQVPQKAFNSNNNGQTSNDMHLYKVLLVSMIWNMEYGKLFTLKDTYIFIRHVNRERITIRMMKSKWP